MLGAWVVGVGEAMRWWEGRQLDVHGRVTEARIVDRYSWTDSKGGSKSYWARVNFVPEGGERLNVEARISAAYFQAHQDPSTSRVQVRYLPQKPAIAVIEGERPFPTGAVVGLVMAVAGGLLGGLWIKGLMNKPYWVESGA